MALTDSDGKKNKSYGNDRSASKAKAKRVLVTDLSKADIIKIKGLKRMVVTDPDEAKMFLEGQLNKKVPPTKKEIKGVLEGTIKKPTGIFS